MPVPGTVMNLITLTKQKREHFNSLAKSNRSSAIADHVKTLGHNIKEPTF